MPNLLLCEQQGHVVTLTMNEPERRDPLTGNSAVPDFLAAIDRIHNDRNVHAVILARAGTAFPSGGDIRVQQLEDETFTRGPVRQWMWKVMASRPRCAAADG